MGDQMRGNCVHPNQMQMNAVMNQQMPMGPQMMGVPHNYVHNVMPTQHQMMNMPSSLNQQMSHNKPNQNVNIVMDRQTMQQHPNQ